MKQSFVSRIVTAFLCTFFHARYERRDSLSSSAAKKSNRISQRSYYRPVGYKITIKKCNNFFVEVTEPKKIKSDKIVFHIHGGSFKMRLNDIYRREAVFYSRLFGDAKVYSVDYRIFPDVSFPTPLDDVYNAYIYVTENEPLKEITVIGDSCGANMAASLCFKLRENKFKLPSSLVLFSFWGDLSNSGISYRDNCYRDPFYGIPKRLSYEDCEARIRKITDYAQDQDLHDPYLSPCFGDFKDFPKTVFVTGTADISQSDSITAYEKIIECGTEAYLLNYENMFHDFQLVKCLPETKRVFKFIKKTL